MTENADDVAVATDVCALPLARRMAAMLDREPASLREGDALPHGWHAMLFNAPTRQRDLRADGAAFLGVPLPDIGLPRLMLGGRRNRFVGEIPIGATVLRETRRGEVQLKEGRSGRFALLKVEHRIFVAGGTEAVVMEHQDYVLRAAEEQPAAAAGTPRAAAATASSASDQPMPPGPVPEASCTLVPDERLLFRYSAITDNPHRIHYDHPYATGSEHYGALVVNGSIPAMFLLEMFRQHTGREPATFASRNLAPMLCGRPLVLNLLTDGQGIRLWAVDAEGRTTFDARAD